MENLTPIQSVAQFGTELRHVPASAWNQCLRDTPTEFLAIAQNDPVQSVAEFEPLVELLKSDPQLKMLLQFPPMSDLALAWQTFPHRLAALRENPALGMDALVLKVSASKELGFQDVSEPLWDFIIRASTTPGSIQVQESSGKPQSEETDRNPDLPELAPQPPGRSLHWLQSHLQSVSPEELVPRVASAPDAIALKAGLFQMHDYLDASHELSQSIEGQGRHSAGDYWHAIMHRREPDYSNAKYWFRHVGSHPIFEPLAKAVDSILSRAEDAAGQTARQKLLAGGGWDPFAFVDFCQECSRGGDPELTELAKRIQWQEMRLLLEQTYRDAAE